MTIFLLSFASGFIGLGYQVMWFRIYADRFGSTNLTFLLVLVGFIGGLGLGSLSSRTLAIALSRIPRLADPLALVAAIEVAIAAAAALTFFVDLSGMTPWIGAGAFPYVVDERGIFEPLLSLRVATAVATGCILLPTFLMGTTFPILCDAFRDRRSFPSELYAWNTMGACAGVLAAECLLLPGIGHSRSLLVLLAVNVGLAIAFAAYGKRHRGRPVAGAAPLIQSSPQRSSVSRMPGSLEPSTMLTVAGLSGFVAGALEVDMLRYVRFAGAISDAAMSFTSFWAIVAIFTASWTVRALGSPRPGLLRVAIPMALVAHAANWYWLPELRGWFNARYVAWLSTHAALNPQLAGAEIYPLSGSLLLLLAFTGVVVMPAYYSVSLLLPTVCNALQGDNRHLGRAYGVNTLAFCTGAVVFTWIAPGVSLFYAVKLGFVFIAIAAAFSLTLRPGVRVSRGAAAAALVVALAGVGLVPRGFDRAFFPSDEPPARYPVRAMKSNAAHTTYVVEDPEGDVLYFDSHPMSGTGPLAQRYMRLMAHVPLLGQANPQRALLICFGVGNTARAIAAHESIEAIDVVDLNERVYETAVEFADINARVYDDPRVRLIHDDGRTFLGRTEGCYDLITSEPPPPRSAGVYRLYSVEYYQSALERLTPSGMMTQWLPLNVVSGEAADRIIASFVSVFPQALLFVGSDKQLILLGSRVPFDGALLERRFEASPGARRDLADIGIREPLAILARITRIGDALRADVSEARLISDERNDLAHTVTDPFDPPMMTIDPKAVFQALASENLACAPRLAEALSHPRRLRLVVPDFPFSLALVPGISR